MAVKFQIGVGLAFLCMVLATIIILCLRFLQNVHHGVLNTFLYTWAFVSTFPVAAAMGSLEIPDNPWDIVGMLGVGVLWALGNTFLVLALQHEEAGVVALIRTSEVIFTFFWQMVILKVYPDLIRYLCMQFPMQTFHTIKLIINFSCLLLNYCSLFGAVLVLTGVIVVTLRKWVAALNKDNPLKKRLAFLLY